MPNAERIAELQRLAYGAGTTAAERLAAVAELEAIGRVRVAEPAEPGSHDANTDTAVDSRSATCSPVVREEPVEHPADASTTRPARPFALAGAIAVALGIGWAAGMIAAPGTAAESTAPTAGAPIADDVARPPTETVPSSDPFAEAPAMAVFERGQVETDRTPIATVGDPMFDPLSQRRLVTLGDGGIFSAALDETGGICLAFDRPEGGGTAMCTSETAFPPEGLHLDSMFESRIAYELHWYPSGEVRVLRNPAG
jgi:hypothetical protein